MRSSSGEAREHMSQTPSLKPLGRALGTEVVGVDVSKKLEHPECRDGDC
jgi:hypothetical protein